MIREFVRGLGFDVVRFPYGVRSVDLVTNTSESNRLKLLEHYNIDLILDVGANDGGFGRRLRDQGFQKTIISFEPLSDAFAGLSNTAKSYHEWQVNNFALGSEDGEAEINIANNSVSSSLLDMGKQHLESAPESQFVGKQKITVKKLDSIFHQYGVYKNIYLKLDVQGFEKHVLDGAQKSLQGIKGIQTEMSLEELYTGELTFFEYSQYLLSLGFKLKSIEPGFFDPKSGQLLQVDGIWFR